jgi:hypothetical protein
MSPTPKPNPRLKVRLVAGIAPGLVGSGSGGGGVGPSGGGGGATVKVKVACTVPTVPVQLKKKSPLLVSGPTVSAPETALLPDQLPDAEQDCELVLCHVSVTESPERRDEALPLRASVGAGGGGWVCGGPLEPPPPPQAPIADAIAAAARARFQRRTGISASMDRIGAGRYSFYSALLRCSRHRP